MIFGLKDCPFEGGYYLGMLKFPPDYPWKPPSILLLSESQRFKVKERICLSISDYHPETWNPVWPVRSIILGLISFFVIPDYTVGAIENPSIEKQVEAAKKSKKILLQTSKFVELFETYF